MKIDFVPPTSLVHQETGLISMLARISLQEHQTSLIRCNGIVGLCHRDEESMWHRNFDSCFNCMQERNLLSQWTGASLEDLSPYVLSEDINQTRRWINESSFENLLTSSFDGCKPWEWIQSYFASRFNQHTPTITNRNHEIFVRRFALSVLRMRIAARRYLFAKKPDVLAVADGQDIIAQSFKEVAADFGINLYTFKWRNDARIIRIDDYHRNLTFDSDVVVNNVVELRNDPASWPSELINRLHQILEFMQIETKANFALKYGNGAKQSA